MEYTKNELKEAEKFKSKIDIIEALFDEDKTYTIEEAEAIINGFLKGRVK